MKELFEGLKQMQDSGVDLESIVDVHIPAPAATVDPIPEPERQKTVLITGGSRGIGKAMAEKFMAEGWYVIITMTKQPSEFIHHANEWYSIDFTDTEALGVFCEFIKNKKKIDAVINNAGVNDIRYLPTVAEENYDRLMDVNLKAPYFLTQACVAAGAKKVVHVGSIMSVTSREKRTLYSTSKAGLTGMARAMAAELGPQGVLVNVLSPGFTMTDLTRASLSQEEMDKLFSQIPVGRAAEPFEMANVAYFLCSDQNTFMTGQNIVIDGGFTII